MACLYSEHFAENNTWIRPWAPSNAEDMCVIVWPRMLCILKEILVVIPQITWLCQNFVLTNHPSITNVISIYITVVYVNFDYPFKILGFHFVFILFLFYVSFLLKKVFFFRTLLNESSICNLYIEHDNYSIVFDLQSFI